MHCVNIYFTKHSFVFFSQSFFFFWKYFLSVTKASCYLLFPLSVLFHCKKKLHFYNIFYCMICGNHVHVVCLYPCFVYLYALYSLYSGVSTYISLNVCVFIFIMTFIYINHLCITPMFTRLSLQAVPQQSIRLLAFIIYRWFVLSFVVSFWLVLYTYGFQSWVCMYNYYSSLKRITFLDSWALL